MDALDVLADYGDLCGEGPLWNPREQNLYWTDITGKRFYRCAWPSRRHEVLREGFELGGFTFQAGGGFIVVNSSGFWIWDGAGDPALICEAAEGRKCALNDCAADAHGRVLAGSVFWEPDRGDYQRGCLFRMDTDGTVQVADEGFGLANGMGFSPDNGTLYFTDSAERTIHAYDYRPQDGAVRNRRVFVKVPGNEGVPDGLTVDAEGFVWSAQWFGACIVRYDPDGREERRIATPAAQTSSLTFGGPEFTDIFITSAGASDALPLAPPGYSPENRNIGGQLYHLNSGIRGKEEYMSRIVHALPR
jgi:sugar lactone lactonase YvrE